MTSSDSGSARLKQLRVESIGDQLRQKISNKFQTSTFLAGFSASILSIQVTFLWQHTARPGLLPFSIAILVAALMIYVAAIIKLDELTMPKRFWEEDSNVHDVEAAEQAFLEQRDLWELKSRMIFYWYRLTMVATGLAAASLTGLLFPWVPHPAPISRVDITAILSATAVVGAASYLCVVRIIARRTFSPLLRPSD